jgi:hypothetical protein
MTTPAANPNEPSKFKRILNANTIDESIASRLPRGNRVQPPEERAPIIIAPAPPENTSTASRYKFLPAFWTVASIMSITVNIVLLAVVFILLQMLGEIRASANNQVSNLLSQLYGNFAAMDNATISRTIPVDTSIPLDISVPVNLFDPDVNPQAQSEMISLAEDAVISNAHVEIHEGGVDINARAIVRLPKGTPLSVNLKTFTLPVKTSVPVQMNVLVDIPLKETALHQPFVGLRDIVQPYYCMVQPKATLINGQACP